MQFLNDTVKEKDYEVFFRIILFKNIMFMIFLSLIFTSLSFAKTIYMGSGEEFTNLQSAMSSMSGGDILIIRNGTYTGRENILDATHLPPSGNYGDDKTDRTSDDVWTVIQAETNGGVIFDGEHTNIMFNFDSGNSYIKFQGIEWKNTASGMSQRDGSSPTNIKFISCGFSNASNLNTSVASGASCIYIDSSEYILLEDCYVYGNFRYGFYIADSSQYIILRRCVGRQDSCNTTTGAAAFMIYDAQYVELQNCISIDADSDSAYYLDNNNRTYTYSFNFRDTGSGYGMDYIHARGCISLNQAQGAGSFSPSDAAPDVDIENSVFWDTKRGNRYRAGGVDLDHCTVGNVFGDDGTNTYMHGIYLEAGSSMVTNTIVYNVDNADALRGPGGNGNYNCLYENPEGNYQNWTPGANDITTIDPTAGSLEYLVRIENSSDLDGAASDKGDIGATILKKIGTGGTLWGESGYNTTTEDNLWPFPNEDMIRTKMAAYTWDDGSGGDPEITGGGGFCAVGQTLTRYIWEYLGNPIPSDIYGEVKSIGTEVPSAPSDVTIE